MKRQTRQLILNVAAGLAIAATAAVVLMPGVATAAPASATQAVNVRADPSTSARIVDRLRPGEQVDVQRCRTGWCYVITSDNEGWVSAQYLAGIRPQSNVQFGFSIDSTGKPSVQFGINTRPPAVDDEDDVAEVCFYERTRMRGQELCLDEGEQIRDLDDFADEISSIDNPDRLSVTVCTDTRFRGDCRTYSTSSNSLGGFDDDIESIRVR